MSSDGIANLDPLATAFVFDAIDLGMQYAELEANGFIPFATILGKDGSKQVWKLFDNSRDDSTVEGGVDLGRQRLREVDETVHCVTLVYDGYFTGDGGRTEAVFVEAYELGRQAGVHMCQRYERHDGGVSLIGNPLLFDDETQPLVPADRSAPELPNLGPRARQFTLDAIERGIEHVEGGAPGFTPFAAILGDDGSSDVWRFADDDDPNFQVGDAVALGRERLLSVDRTSHCVTLVWGSALQDEDNAGVVFAEGYELGRPAGVLLAQQYEWLDHDRVVRIGDPVVLEEPEPLVPADRLGEFDNLDAQSGDFVFETIDLALEHAAESEHGFLPFATVLARDGSKELARLVDDEDNPTIEGGVMLGRQRLREVNGSAHCVTLCWDGYLTLEGRRTDAVFVEGYELGRPVGVLLAQRYERHSGGLDRIDVPVLCEEPEPLVPPKEPR
ncbi:hypothetical protein FHU38_002486 [Saccharomonospora amisosensis]|uniref:Uncharacterized protein n=1 Tax=Saccharomonospora amisosensis TaxID=1128677 RepID=A0A7X5UQQ4_9PSEU|nr:hypothetical protein [Saccharomonospora amisosensis]NIJ12142.1 hypothetical protein [Saccharomonospora amisosensis]